MKTMKTIRTCWERPAFSELEEKIDGEIIFLKRNLDEKAILGFRLNENVDLIGYRTIKDGVKEECGYYWELFPVKEKFIVRLKKGDLCLKSGFTFNVKRKKDVDFPFNFKFNKDLKELFDKQEELDDYEFYQFKKQFENKNLYEKIEKESEEDEKKDNKI